MITDVTGILLAGGKSRRMGEDKRFLVVGERTLLERSCAVLRDLFEQVCVVIAQDGPDLQTEVPFPVLRDLIPNLGSLGGLYTGLRQATTQHIFLAACDMPFLNSNLVHYMIECKKDVDIVMARWEQRLQPTHAVYGRRCLPILDEMISRHDMKIQNLIANPSLRVQLLTQLELNRIDPEGRSFRNINTPADLEAARALEGGSLHS
jgi:molybdenum cofactor guanylyltransferase